MSNPTSHDDSFPLCQMIAFQASLIEWPCDPVLDNEKGTKSAGSHLGRIFFLDKNTGFCGEEVLVPALYFLLGMLHARA